MAFTAAKDICSQQELNRFACAFLNCKDIHAAIDWDAAAQQFDPAVKTASFRTVTQRVMKKVFAAAGGGDGAEGMKAAGQKGKGGGGGGGGKKRKAAADGEEGGEGEGEGEKPVAKKGRKAGGKGRGAKKAKADSVVDEEGAEGEGVGEDADKVKTEAADEEDELAF